MNHYQTGLRLVAGAAVITCLLLTAHTVLAAVTTPPDVVGHWSSPEVCRLIVQEVIRVDPDGLFRPQKYITRSELVRALVIAIGHREDAVALHRAPRTFRDISILHPEGGFIEVAAELGLARGYPDGRFLPDKQVTRSELAAFLVRAMGLDNRVGSYAELLPFSDRSSIRHWAVGYIGVAYECGLVRGFDDGRFHPESFTTRAEMAVIIARMMEQQGTAWSVAGTYRGRIGQSLRVLVRDEAAPVSIAIASQPVIFRNGSPATLDQIERGDQVFVVVNSHGQITYLHAYWLEEVGMFLVRTVAAATFTMTVDPDIVRTISLTTDALIFRNGRSAKLTDLELGDRIYVVYDALSGNARVVDAVRVDGAGTVHSVQTTVRTVTITVKGVPTAYQLADNVLIVVNGNPVSLTEIVIGDHVTAFVVDADRIVYLEVRRSV